MATQDASDGACLSHSPLARRAVLRSILAGVLSLSFTGPALVANAEDGAPVPAALSANKLYNGPTSYGFKFKYPASWKANKKIGNKHLYDLEVKPNKGGGSMSITIDKTPANSMQEFGALDTITEKLRGQLQSSQKGDAVKVVGAREEQTRDKKMTYYTIELEDSKSKRFSKITITAQQLFVMQIDVPKSDTQVLATMTQQALASFQVQPNYLENFQGVNGEKVVGQAPELGDYFKRIPKDIIQVESGDF